jgi:long-chain acyl-CoA synthetase
MINAPDGNGVGEVWTAGANVMQGYYNNSDATRAIMSGDWLRTGDLGYLDSDGYLFLTGRMKNLIVTHAGKNVYPEEIETKLSGDLVIAEALVLAPKRTNREADTLCCLVRPNLEHIAAHHPHDSVDKVIEHVIRKYNEHVPAYQKIREWKIVDEFKKTSTGKIKRFLYTEEFK